MGLSAISILLEGEAEGPRMGEVLYPLERAAAFGVETLLIAYPLFSLRPVGLAVGISDWMPSEDKLAAVVSAGTRRLGFRSRRAFWFLVFFANSKTERKSEEEEDENDDEGW